MAVARPIRMLGAASIILCLFLIFQLNKGPTTVLGSQGKLSSMKADPLLQRALVPFDLQCVCLYDVVVDRMLL